MRCVEGRKLEKKHADATKAAYFYEETLKGATRKPEQKEHSERLKREKDEVRVAFARHLIDCPQCRTTAP